MSIAIESRWIKLNSIKINYLFAFRIHESKFRHVLIMEAANVATVNINVRLKQLTCLVFIYEENRFLKYNLTNQLSYFYGIHILVRNSTGADNLIQVNSLSNKIFIKYRINQKFIKVSLTRYYSFNKVIPVSLSKY